MSEVGREEEEMVGVLPTLLPKRRIAEPVKDHNMDICREEVDGRGRTRTYDPGIMSRSRRLRLSHGVASLQAFRESAEAVISPHLRWSC